MTRLRKLLLIEIITMIIAVLAAANWVYLQPLLLPIFPKRELPKGWIDSTHYMSANITLREGGRFYDSFYYYGSPLYVIRMDFDFITCEKKGTLCFRVNRALYIVDIDVKKPAHKSITLTPCCYYLFLLIPDELNVIGFFSPSPGRPVKGHERGYEGTFRYIISTVLPPRVSKEAKARPEMGNWNTIREVVALPSLSIGTMSPATRNPLLEPMSISLYDTPGRHCYITYLGVVPPPLRLRTEIESELRA